MRFPCSDLLVRQRPRWQRLKAARTSSRSSAGFEVLVERRQSQAEREEAGVESRPRLLAPLEDLVEALLEDTQREHHRLRISELRAQLRLGLAQAARARTGREAGRVVEVVPLVDRPAASAKVVSPKGDGGLRTPQPAVPSPPAPSPLALAFAGREPTISNGSCAWRSSSVRFSQASAKAALLR